MARRGLTGQLNMFDFFSSLEEGTSGDVEMVSLMPNFDDEPELPEHKISEPEVVKREVVETVEPISEFVEAIEPETISVKEIVEKESTQDLEKAVMSRAYEREGKKIEIAYLNYNKVRITSGNNEPEIIVFETSKEAVDYYVEQMQKLESEEEE